MPGPIPEQTIEEVRNRTDIVEIVGESVQLKKRGHEYWACCPFHKEKTPSFKVSPDHQSYHCFGCGTSGNVFTFLMAFENLDFPAAVRLLAQRANVIIPESNPGDQRKAAERRSRQETLNDILEGVARWYASLLNSEVGEPARQYLTDRGIPPAVAADFGLGYSKDEWNAAIEWGERRNYSVELLEAAGLVAHNEERDRRYDRFRGRLMFPIRDHLGRLVGFSARTLDPEAKTAKYVNSPETEVFRKSCLLYGLDRARRQFREHGHALVCEGQLDVIACHRAGLDHAVAPQGTAFTAEQARLLKRFCQNLVFAFDADEAGQKAAVRSVVVALEEGLDVAVAPMPQGEDPDSILRSRGPEALAATVENPLEGFEFLLHVARLQHPDDSPAGKTEIVDFLLPALYALQNPVRQSAQLSWLSEQLSVPESAVQQAFALHRQRVEKRSGASSGRTAPSAPAPPSGATVPYQPTHATAGPAKAEAILLDLALRHGAIAHQLADDLPSDGLSNAPTGQALNIVLAHTQQGEWAHASHYLANDNELIENPDVGRVLASSAFRPPPGDDATAKQREEYREMLERAKNEALHALERARTQQRMHTLQTAIRNETETEVRTRLTQEYVELARTLAALRRPAPQP
mgnify:CR=1 FL=1